MNKWFPDRKWLASGVAGVLTFAVCTLARQFGYDIPPSIEPSLVIAMSGLVAYLTPQSLEDILKRLNDDIVRLAQEDPRVPVTSQGNSNGK